jgi:anti-sigma B factor antagonist
LPQNDKTTKFQGDKQMLDINVTRTQPHTQVLIGGDIDSETAPEVEEKLLPLIGDDCKLLVDMGGVGFMSSAGLRMLFTLRRQMPGSGKLVLVRLSEQIKDTMLVTGFMEYFTVAEDMNEAVRLVA